MRNNQYLGHPVYLVVPESYWANDKRIFRSSYGGVGGDISVFQIRHIFLIILSKLVWLIVFYIFSWLFSICISETSAESFFKATQVLALSAWAPWACARSLLSHTKAADGNGTTAERNLPGVPCRYPPWIVLLQAFSAINCHCRIFTKTLASRPAIESADTVQTAPANTTDLLVQQAHRHHYTPYTVWSSAVQKYILGFRGDAALDMAACE